MSAPVELIKQRARSFTGLSDDKQLKALANNFTERVVHGEGQELTCGGNQRRRRFFVIESGQASVTVDGEVRRTLGQRRLLR